MGREQLGQHDPRVEARDLLLGRSEHEGASLSVHPPMDDEGLHGIPAPRLHVVHDLALQLAENLERACVELADRIEDGFDRSYWRGGVLRHLSEDGAHGRPSLGVGADYATVILRELLRAA